jgi:hypothetical protein
MAKIIDRLLIGGAFVVSGVVHRRVGEVGDRVEAVERSVDEIGHRPPVAGMPLPTGYGLQVQGPAGEDILVPVCLPPGFELGSLVLRPEFLPGGGRPHHAEPSTPAPSAADPAPSAPPPVRAAGQPLGDAISIVYGNQPGYRHQLSGESTTELDASIL